MRVKYVRYLMSAGVLGLGLFSVSALPARVSAQVAGWQQSGNDTYYDAGKVEIRQTAASQGLVVNQSNISGENMLRLNFAGGDVGSTNLEGSIARVTSNSYFRNLMSLEGANGDAVVVDANGNLNLGSGGRYTYIDSMRPVGTLNPGYTTAGTIIRNMPDQHFIIDINGNDAEDAFAIRTSSNADMTPDRISFKVQADGSVCIGNCTVNN